MFPVYFNARKKEVDFVEFVDKFYEICAYHQTHGRASAFAFIIYDFYNPHIAKILEDPHYWRSLNTVSGHYLTLFCLLEGRVKHKFNDTLIPYKSKSRSKEHNHEDSDLSEKYRQIIELFFGNVDFPTPSVLFFQVENEKISDHFFVELKENKFEEGFNELLLYIKKSIEAIAQIAPENRHNYQEAFHMLEINVESAVWWKKMKKKASKAINLINFLSIFKS